VFVCEFGCLFWVCVLMMFGNGGVYLLVSWFVRVIVCVYCYLFLYLIVVDCWCWLGFVCGFGSLGLVSCYGLFDVSVLFV